MSFTCSENFDTSDALDAAEGMYVEVATAVMKVTSFMVGFVNLLSCAFSRRTIVKKYDVNQMKRMNKILRITGGLPYITNLM